MNGKEILQSKFSQNFKNTMKLNYFEMRDLIDVNAFNVLNISGHWTIIGKHVLNNLVSNMDL